MHKRKKYSFKLKIKLVKELLKRNNSANGLSAQHKIPRTSIRQWIGQYQKFGIKGLQRRKNHSYPLAFKLKVIGAYKSKNLSLRECCLQYDIPSQSTIISWIKKLEKFGEDSLRKPGRPKSMKAKKTSTKKSKPLTRLEELEKENLYLRAENELLKKLEALAQKKQAPQKKKR